MNLLIVDDEPLTTQGLTLLIDWHNYGFDGVYSAENGFQALKIIEKVRPALVFADIRMPGMSGLDMIRQAKAIIPNATFVIISGYNDYTYVRSAIQLNIFDYIEKPVTIDKVKDVLHNYVQSRKNVTNNATPSQRAMVLETLRSCMLNGELAQQELTRIWNNGKTLMPAFAQALRVSGLSSDLAQEKIERMLKAIGVKTASCQVSNGMTLLTYGSEIFDCVKRVREWVSDGFEGDANGEDAIHIGMSHVGAFAGLPGILREAQFAMEYAIFFDEPFLFIDDVEYSTHLPLTLNAGEKNLCFLLRLGDRQGALTQVRELMQNLNKANVSMDLFIHEALELVYLGLQICKEADAGFRRETMLPNVEIQKCRTADEISEWVCQSFEEILDTLTRQKYENGRTRVLRAKDYIDGHFGEVITLEQLSERCGMHPVYFSTLFKAEVGQSFVKYLNEVRMQRAKEMLVANVPLKNVAELTGFSNARYFCDRFRQCVGCTPTEYRKKHQGEKGE